MLPITFSMNLSEPFIRRPVMTTLIMIGIVIYMEELRKNLSKSKRKNQIQNLEISK